MKKEHFYRLGHVNQKTQAYNANYMKSFLHRHRFKTQAMQTFKATVRDRNTYREQEAIKSIDQLMHENIKHEQNKLFVKKREHVQFDFEMAQSLLQGKFHGEPVDEDLN